MQLYLFLFFLVSFVFPTHSSAHAFGTTYTLPIPFWLYAYGGIAALIISFFIIGYFSQKQKTKTSYYTYIFPQKLTNIFINQVLKHNLQCISISLFIFTITTGLLGTNDATQNFSMTFFWIIIILGFTYLNGILGNIWSIFNPWFILINFFSYIIKDPITGIVAYPKNLGYLPAFIFYFFFIWLELVEQTTPFSLSIILIIYTIITLNGVFIFGKKSWFKYAEFFTIFFSLLSYIGFFTYKNEKLFLKPLFLGLTKTRINNISLLLFIIFMLSSTAYDGFRETVPATIFLFSLTEILFSYLGSWTYTFIETGGLLFTLGIFFIIYLLAIIPIRYLTKSSLSIKTMLLKFAPSLIPIAFVYNIAHYYTLLIIQGQEIIRLISDPFGWGWNLFKTTSYQLNINLLDLRFIWNSQVFLILAGHIAAVYIAHLIAISIFPTQKKALVSQIPLLLVMIGYTIIGLWILSQPLVSG